MRFLYGVVATLLVMVLSGLAFVYSGVYNVTATEAHGPIGQWALHTTMRQSVASRAVDIEVPADLSDEAMIRQGARAYDQLCAACHLKPGQDSSLIRTGLNPTPPDLTQAGDWTPEEQFWIIKNGIRMTGMPAWGETHDDADLWELTAFVRHLPSLSEPQYAALLQVSGDAPADDGHDHDHGNMGAMMSGSGDDHHAEASGADMGTHHDNVEGHHDTDAQQAPSGGDVHDNSDGHHDDAAPAAGEDDHYSDGHTH
ncbi:MULTISPECIES: c-type cytochrome [Marinobacter]|uniref:c-type cytochrome n=1 Tax=Marinobacter TaxID=2742 RepID=UPI000DAE3602|nr:MULTISPECIES: cytochrome c [Marinobacter]